MKVLITGIAGFYGHHLAKYLQEKTDWEIVGIDRLDEGGSLDRLKEIEFKGKVYYHDLRSPVGSLLSKKIGKVEIVLHLAAMSHVDRSIVDPVGAVHDNILGTLNILEFCRKCKPKKFLYFSTDEVFGPNKGTGFKELDPLSPKNPYSASKAGGEMLCESYLNTFNVPIIITRCMNIFGERQHPEKFIPKATGLLLSEKIVPIYYDSKGTISGSRSYIYADDVTRALLLILEKGRVGEKYNIEGSKKISNLKIAEIISENLNKPLRTRRVKRDQIRPGNDFCYSISGSKLKKMGFKIKESNIQKIKDVVLWYTNNTRWLYI